MATAYPFAVPSLLPQDLQIIQDIVGQLPPDPVAQKVVEPALSDHDHGTDSETDSEQEVEDGILGNIAEESSERFLSKSTSDSDTSSDSDSDSDSVSDKPRGLGRPQPKRVEMDLDDDDNEPAISSETQLRTKNEVVEADVKIPEITRVEPDERLEFVGQVMSIVDKVVIVKGNPSSVASRGSESVLDSDTLLVFEDRNVLGYVFETFGPTSEPMYQIKFTAAYPVDMEKVQVGRSVYHVPNWSHYVFVQQLRHYKGSDASNVHDEEPGEDELEFSDDEQEAAHKKAQTLRRELARGRSVASSRHSTPLPSRMRGQDMAEDPYGGSTYDSGLSYSDIDPGAESSRPAPIPYDDPYSDVYDATVPEVKAASDDVQPQAKPEDGGAQPLAAPFAGTQRGRGRGRGSYTQRQVDGDKNPGRGRRNHERGRGRGRGRGADPRGRRDSWTGAHNVPADEYDPHQPRPLSPTSLAIARATGQYEDGTSVPAHVDPAGGWGYTSYPMPSFDFSMPYQYPQIQPHINPRFAANFGMMGMNMGHVAHGSFSSPYSPDTSGYAVGGNESAGWHQGWGSGAEMPSHPGRRGGAPS